MAQDIVRVGLVGCGGMGMGHLGMLMKQPNVKVIAVCDIRPERAERAKAASGAEAYTDMAEMLAKADIDAVDIVTYSGLHAEQSLMAINAGKHVLCEKPFDLNLAKIDRAIAAADEKGVVLACVFQNRYGTEIQRANRLIKEGKLGKIISCSTYAKWWRGQDYYNSDPTWRGTWALDGGCLANQGIHSIDQLCWMGGPVAEVEYAHIATVAHKMEAEDFAIAVVRFENGARGVVEGATSAYPGFSSRTEIFGEKGSGQFDGNRVVSFSVQGEEIDLTTKEEKQGDGKSDPMAIGLGGHEAQVVEFINCILHGTKPGVEGREARVAVDALLKIYAKAGAPIPPR